MSNFLFDTNVLSEMTRREPNQKVKAFLNGLPLAFVSILTVHELKFGLRSLPDSQRKTAMTATIDGLLELYQESILPVGLDEAKASAEIRAEAQIRGRVVDIADGLIAGTALVHGLTVVTRNEKDFAGLGVSLLNPWTSK